MRELKLRTERKVQALDITEMVSALGHRSGLVWVNTPHTTAGLILCEADAEMLQDVERAAAELFAPLEPFKHHRNDNPNAAAHLTSSFLGTQLLLPTEGGRLAVGGYQRLLFVELDGPRERRVQIADVQLAD